MNEDSVNEVLEEENHSDTEIPELLEDGGMTDPQYQDALKTMDEHMDMIFEHQRKINNHNRMLEKVLEEYDRLVPNFRNEYLGLMDTLIDHIEDRRLEKKDQATADLVKGAAFLGGGVVSSFIYGEVGESIIDFYATTPELYSQNPEGAIISVGLPVLGAYMFKRSYDKYQEQAGYRSERKKFQKARREFKEREEE